MCSRLYGGQLMKIMWLDTETTGTKPWIHDIIQMAGIVEIDGREVEQFEFKCQPHDLGTVEEGAIKTHGISIEEMADYPKPSKVWNQFCRLLDSHIDKYNKEDKFIMAGYNVGFDFDMLQNWWRKCEQSYFGSYFQYKQFDLYPLVFLFDHKYKWGMSRHTLVDICDLLNIGIDAHDALADIRATKDVYERLCDMLPKEIQL